MSETIPKKCAVVTGGNKGIGFEICSQLAAKGVRVVLTARDEKKGVEAVQKLNDANVTFHQLDVTDSQSVQSLAQYVKSQFGKLDILVNNAGITGADIDADALKASSGAGSGTTSGGAKNVINWNEIMTETYESAIKCFETNYYGPKRTTEALISILELSESPKVVNVSSSMGKLKNISNEWAKGVLRKPSEDLTESEIDGVINEFLNDFKVGGHKKLEAKGWPQRFSAYTVSKAALNAYTRILATRYPNFRINCVCPGFVKTDMNHHTGVFTVQEGAEGPVNLALSDGPSTGLFFDRKGVSSFQE